jgi:hypothetical protein
MIMSAARCASEVPVTEFCWWCHDEPFWQGLKDKTGRLRGHVWIMSERPHLDRYAPPRGIKGETVLATLTEEGQHWATGPHHGRKERQVELSWRIERLSYVELRRLVGRLKRATQPLWERAGVGVC